MTNFLFIDYSLYGTDKLKADPQVLTYGFAGAMIIGAFALLLWYYEWKNKKRPTVIPFSQPVDNVDTRAVAIANQIRKVEDEEKLYKTLALIKRYECDYLDDYNAQREAEGLREVWNARARNIYGIEEVEAPELENNSLVKAR